MIQVSTIVEQGLSDAQKKRTKENSSSKKAKKTGGKKVSSMLKKLIEELLANTPVPSCYWRELGRSK